MSLAISLPSSLVFNGRFTDQGSTGKRLICRFKAKNTHAVSHMLVKLKTNRPEFYVVRPIFERIESGSSKEFVVKCISGYQPQKDDMFMVQWLSVEPSNLIIPDRVSWKTLDEKLVQCSFLPCVLAGSISIDPITKTRRSSFESILSDSSMLAHSDGDNSDSASASLVQRRSVRVSPKRAPPTSTVYKDGNVDSVTSTWRRLFLVLIIVSLVTTISYQSYLIYMASHKQ
jgi:hypothetical protein